MRPLLQRNRKILHVFFVFNVRRIISGNFGALFRYFSPFKVTLECLNELSFAFHIELKSFFFRGGFFTFFTSSQLSQLIGSERWWIIVLILLLRFLNYRVIFYFKVPLFFQRRNPSFYEKVNCFDLWLRLIKLKKNFTRVSNGDVNFQ